MLYIFLFYLFTFIYLFVYLLFIHVGVSTKSRLADAYSGRAVPHTKHIYVQANDFFFINTHVVPTPFRFFFLLGRELDCGERSIGVK